jgi:hypothetical protein
MKLSEARHLFDEVQCGGEGRLPGDGHAAGATVGVRGGRGARFEWENARGRGTLPPPAHLTSSFSPHTTGHGRAGRPFRLGLDAHRRPLAQGESGGRPLGAPKAGAGGGPDFSQTLPSRPNAQIGSRVLGLQGHSTFKNSRGNLTMYIILKWKGIPVLVLSSQNFDLKCSKEYSV